MQEQQLVSAIVVFDIDGVVRDVGGSYRRALADTVGHFTAGAYRPTSANIDNLKSEGVWNNDWEASQELIFRYFETQGQPRSHLQLDYQALVTFFQSRYRGPNPDRWTGYICNEPLLLQPSYLQQLSAAGICWGFFSGATRASATYVLTTRLGLHSPILIAMEDAPGKPDPTGLLATVKQIEQHKGVDSSIPVLYAGDTVADMYTVERARSLNPSRCWIGVGILPPHVQETPARRDAYAKTLKASGATAIFGHIEQLNPARIRELILSKS
ncbi:MAG: TIGR01548 family HAD-type hydrolase [Chroococcidiopsidaceae cyanobacterium CP_BM_ER_R8_30]|nr:TIGR01548 family HAD-type hydrolase [Chroococcidiopsidaceae cyanobacterium CP_BM_ER_R8_30]